MFGPPTIVTITIPELTPEMINLFFNGDRGKCQDTDTDTLTG